MPLSLEFEQAARFDAVKWAAEEVALELGWLRECPYHGEPFKVVEAGLGVNDAQPGAQAPCGASPELISRARSIAGTYTDRCAHCTRENALE